MLNRLVFVTLVVLAIAAGAAGQASAPPTWQPSVPEGLPTDFDWIRLSSSEWLKGEIISMYDDKLEFDSDELGVLHLDWGDVHGLRSSRVVQVGREGAESLVGKLMVEEGSATIFGADQVEFDRAAIVTIIAGEPRELNLWSFKVTLGGNFRSGNTDQVEYSARASAMRRSVRNRLSLDYIGNLSSLDGEENANNARVNLGWDYFMNRRLFVNVAGLEWYRDPFQNISSRTGFTAGIGYEIIDTPRTTWTVSAGPAYQMTTFTSVPEGEDKSVDTPAFTTSTSVEVDLTKDIELDCEYKGTITNKDSGRYTHHAVVALDFELTSRLDFNVSWVWDRTQMPTAKADGIVPEQDDFRLSVGLGWDF